MPLGRRIRESLSWRIAITAFAINVVYVNSYLGNPMSKSILDLTVSLVDRGKLNIDPYAYNSTDVSEYQRHSYSGMPPGMSFVCVPYYAIAKTWLWLVAAPARDRRIDNIYFGGPTSVWYNGKHSTVIFLNLFICVFGCSVLAGAMAALFYRALTVVHPDLAERSRLATTWLFSFGTLWFVYSPAIYHRVFSTFLCFSAFLLILPRGQTPCAGSLATSNHQSRSPEYQGNGTGATFSRGLLVGLTLGLAIATSYEIALVAAILILYAARQWGRRWPWRVTAAGIAFFLLLLAAYHTACFGAPWATPYAKRIQGSVVPPLFRDSATTRQPGPYWIGNLVLGAHYGAYLYPLRRPIAFLVGSRYGFFFYSPLLVLALPAVARLWRRSDSHRGLVAVTFGIFVSLFLFHYATGYDGLPGEFGFRMMKPAIPFLMLLVPLSYRWSYRCVVPTLAAFSAVILSKGVMFGVHAGRPFWSDYLQYFARYGFSNYTLANLKDNLWPGLSPWTISAIHLAALGLIGFLLWRFVWRTEATINREKPGSD